MFHKRIEIEQQDEREFKITFLLQDGCLTTKNNFVFIRFSYSNAQDFSFWLRGQEEREKKIIGERDIKNQKHQTMDWSAQEKVECETDRLRVIEKNQTNHHSGLTTLRESVDRQNERLGFLEDKLRKLTISLEEKIKYLTDFPRP